jgi:hypothetical protein
VQISAGHVFLEDAGSQRAQQRDLSVPGATQPVQQKYGQAVVTEITIDLVQPNDAVWQSDPQLVELTQALLAVWHEKEAVRVATPHDLVRRARLACCRGTDEEHERGRGDGLLQRSVTGPPDVWWRLALIETVGDWRSAVDPELTCIGDIADAWAAPQLPEPKAGLKSPLNLPLTAVSFPDCGQDDSDPEGDQCGRSGANRLDPRRHIVQLL